MRPKLSHFKSAWKLAAGTIVVLLVSVQIKDAPVGFVDTDTNGSSSDSSGQCLDLDSNQDMDSLVANARQIFITMPAKAGGTSMKHFTKLCMKNAAAAVHGNILSREGLWKDYLVDSLPLHVQSIIASHLYHEANFLRL
eukprot:scaffold38938_cov205-Skeletonema_dohrnii-CCMP3373.AAC.1